MNNKICICNAYIAAMCYVYDAIPAGTGRFFYFNVVVSTAV